MSRPPWREFRAALDAAGFRPSRRLGQNFLLDDAMVRRIARDTELGPGDVALEVGAGCGFLTAELVERGCGLVAVEIDPRLAEVAARFLGPALEEGAVELVRADALAGKHALDPTVADRVEARRRGGPWHVAGNLPYSVASPLLAVLAGQDEPPRSITALVQAEVAERAAAPPGTRSRGALSVRLQAVYAPRILRRVPPQLFWPRPRVESAVLRLDLRPRRPDPAARARLSGLVEKLFGERRKALRGILARALGDPAAAGDLLEGLGLDPRTRPEELSGEVLRRIADSPAWRERRGHRNP